MSHWQHISCVFLNYSALLFLNPDFPSLLLPTYNKFDMSDLICTFTQLLLSLQNENCHKADVAVRNFFLQIRFQHAVINTVQVERGVKGVHCLLLWLYRFHSRLAQVTRTQIMICISSSVYMH
jgi:hypothetical protein